MNIYIFIYQCYEIELLLSLEFSRNNSAPLVLITRIHFILIYRELIYRRRSPPRYMCAILLPRALRERDGRRERSLWEAINRALLATE